MTMREQLKRATPEYNHQLDAHLRDWHKLNCPWDDIWRVMRHNTTFRDLLRYIERGGDVYNVIFFPGEGDSIVRERLFNALAEMLGVDYDAVYYAWLGTEPPANRLRIVIDMRKEA